MVGWTSDRVPLDDASSSQVGPTVWSQHASKSDCPEWILTLGSSFSTRPLTMSRATITMVPKGMRVGRRQVSDEMISASVATFR